MSLRVAILGGAGFIGSRTASRLVALGHQVNLLDILDPQIHGADLAASGTVRAIWGRVPLVVGDIRDPAAVRRALDGAEVVIYLAAGTGTGQSMYQVRHYADVNVTGAAQLAEELARQRDRIRRVVVSSSRAVYGEGAYLCPVHGRVTPPTRAASEMEAGRFEPACPTCGGPVTTEPSLETDAVSPTSIYGITKLAQEQIILNLCGSLGISAVALRYQNVYGPGQSLKNPYTGILSIFSQLILQGKEINVFEDGLATRDFVFVDDVVHYTCEAATRDLAGTHVLNVGTGQRQTLLDVVETLSRTLGRPATYRISGQFRQGDIRHAAANVDRLTSTLGPRRFTTFAEGVQAFVDWAQTQDTEKAADRRYQDSLTEMRASGLLRGGR